jgi:hypothetical protein
MSHTFFHNVTMLETEESTLINQIVGKMMTLAASLNFKAVLQVISLYNLNHVKICLDHNRHSIHCCDHAPTSS